MTGKKNWWRSSAAQIIAIGSATFLLAFRAPWAFRVNWQNDDGCYLATLGKLAGLATDGMCVRPNYFAPGASVAWIPVGLWGRLSGAITGTDPWLWTIPAIAFFSFALWVASLALIRRILGEDRPLFSLAILLNIPVFYYAVHWAIMPHTLQLIFALSAVLLIKKSRWLSASALAVALTLTRYNDAPIFLLIAGKLLDDGLPLQRRTSLILGTLTAAVGTGIGWLAFIHGYGGLTIPTVFREMTLKGSLHFFIGGSNGVLWMCPWWVLPLFLGLIFFRKLSNFARAALAWMWLEALLCMAWNGTGGDFGYRYLVGSFAGALIVWMDLLRIYPHWIKNFRRLTIAGGVWLVYITWVYRTASILSPMLVKNDQGAMVAAEIPYYFLRTIFHIADPAVYYNAWIQQFPLVTLYMSWNESDYTHLSHLVLQGPPQLLLAFVSLAAVLFLALYGLRSWRE